MSVEEKLFESMVERLKSLPLPLEKKIEELIESAKLLGRELTEEEARGLLSD